MSIAISLFWIAWAVILYTYLFFPMVLAWFARRRSSDPSPESLADERLPRIVIVVAAYNEARHILAKLANTWALDYPADRLQLLIGSDGSDDATPELLKQCTDPRLRCRLFPQRRGKISVLNALMAEVSADDADIVVMSDANTLFAPDALRHLVKHFQDEKIGCVSGELSLEKEGGVSGEGLYWKYEGWIKRSESRLGFLIGCNGAIFALRRALFEPLPPSTIVEDFVLSMRVLEHGYTVRFEPNAKATEPPCPSARAEMVRKIRIGAGGFQALGLTYRLLSPRYGLCAFAFWGHKVLRWLVPCFLLLALAANLWLARSPFFAALFGMQAVGAIVAFAAHLATERWVMPRWTRPVSYFYLMNYALFCGLLRYLFGTQRVTWDRVTSTAPLANPLPSRLTSSGVIGNSHIPNPLD